jgi:D-beta-D-heptose 7-phosphate kinase / D-beta-D-heptose 1-phosphate adenosyltransferase
MNDDFSKKKLVVFGDVILDVYVTGTASRLSPEAPVPIVKKQSRRLVPGGAANVAANISSLGGHFYLYGVVGEDSSAQELSNIFEHPESKKQNYCYFFKDFNHPTITKTRIMVGNHQICRIDKEDRFDLDVTEERYNINFDGVIFSDYNKGTLGNNTRNVIQECLEKGIPTFADFKTATIRYEGVQYIKLNEKEFHEIGRSDDDCKCASSILSELNPHYLIITRGNNPVNVYYHDANILMVIQYPVPDVPVADVSGAGDTFLAAFALSIVNGNTLDESVEFAIKASTIKVKKLGTDTVTVGEISLL